MPARAPGPAAVLAAIVADAVAAALPAFVDTVTAAVLADARTTGIAEHLVVHPAGARPTADQRLQDRLAELLAANPKHRPDDPGDWCAMVAAHYPTAADALAWAWSESCPTSHWRCSRGAPAPARNAERSTRGELDQLIAEHRLATEAGGAAVVAGLDDAAEEVRAVIAERHRARVTYTWRRALLEASRAVDGDLTKVVAVIGWCLRTRPHWQQTISQPPSAKTFAKMRGDWRADGQAWTLSDVTDPEMAEQLCELGRTWMRCQSESGGGGRPSHARTGRNLHRALAGDGIDPVPAADLAALLRWWFEEGNARFHVRDADFPGPDVVARALLAMRTTRAASRSTGVAATNTAASGLRAHTDLTELEGLA